MLAQTIIELERLEKTSGKEEHLGELLSRLRRGLYEASQINVEYETLHLVIGQSTASCLKVGLERENKVLGIPDFFAQGPIWQLHRDIGRTRRNEWEEEHLTLSTFWLMEQHKRRSSVLKELDAIPENKPLVIWAGENASEQTGMRYILYLLRKKTNDIFFINTTKAFQQLSEHSFRYTGEFSPEQLKRIYDNRKPTHPLSDEEKSRFHEEWLSLAETKQVLRIWESEEIKSVPEDYVDLAIVDAAKRLRRSEGDFIRAGALIAEVMEQLEHSVGDPFLEFRIWHLISEGVFHVKGNPKQMSSYRIKLH